MAQGDIIQMMPTGSVHMFPVNSVLAGFLECNGAVVSRTTYAALFAVLGITYGAGDGSTTFGLPDYRGEFLRGWDNGRGVDSGRAIATTQAEETNKDGVSATTNTLGSHTHTSRHYINNQGGTNQGGQITTNSPNTLSIINANGDHSHTVTMDGGSETRPRNMSLMYCIKV